MQLLYLHFFKNIKSATNCLHILSYLQQVLYVQTLIFACNTIVELLLWACDLFHFRTKPDAILHPEPICHCTINRACMVVRCNHLIDYIFLLRCKPQLIQYIKKLLLLCQCLLIILIFFQNIIQSFNRPMLCNDPQHFLHSIRLFLFVLIFIHLHCVSS